LAYIRGKKRLFANGLIRQTTILIFKNDIFLKIDKHA